MKYQTPAFFLSPLPSFARSRKSAHERQQSSPIMDGRVHERISSTSGMIEDQFRNHSRGGESVSHGCTAQRSSSTKYSSYVDKIFPSKRTTFPCNTFRRHRILDTESPGLAKEPQSSQRCQTPDECPGCSLRVFAGCSTRPSTLAVDRLVLAVLQTCHIKQWPEAGSGSRLYN